MRRRHVLLALALTLAACGRRGPPRPPQTRLPRPVADLRGEVRADAIELSWTNPERRADDSRLRDLVVARLFRTEDVGHGDPKPALLSRGRIVGYTELATIPLGPARGAPPSQTSQVQGNLVRVTDRQGLSFGHRYSYVVVVEDALGRVSPPSTRVSLIFIVPPAAPGGLTAQAGEASVQLRWTPPTRLTDGTPLVGAVTYEVLRATAADAPMEVITPTPLNATDLTDRDLENDQTYYYAVRALRRQADTTAVGAPSDRVAATPRDLTPPSAPTDLVGATAPDGVRLSWRASPEPDVAAYVIYRASGGGDFVRIGSTRAPTTVFVDRDVPRGTYRYAVSAQDSGVRPNESTRSSVVSVTVP